MKMHALWWWIDRWRKSSAFMDMTLEEQGAYRNLLDEAVLRGGALPDNPRILAKACGDALAWSRIGPIVMARFEKRADGWHNETLDTVLAKSALIANLRAAAGRAGSAARWGERADDKADDKPIANAIANPITNGVTKKCHPDPDPDLRSEKEKQEAPDLSVRVLRSPPAPNTLTRPIAVPKPSSSVLDPFVDETLTARAGEFIRHYRDDLYPAHRKGARYLGSEHRDYLAAVQLCQTWDDARLEKLAICFLTSDHDFAANGSRTIPQMKALASWLDGRLAEWEAAHGAAV